MHTSEHRSREVDRAAYFTYLLTGERKFTAQERCHSGGGRAGFPVANSPGGLCGRKATLKRKKKEKQRKNRDSTWFVENSAGNIL